MNGTVTSVETTETPDSRSVTITTEEGPRTIALAPGTYPEKNKYVLTPGDRVRVRAGPRSAPAVGCSSRRSPGSATTSGACGVRTAACSGSTEPDRWSAVRVEPKPPPPAWPQASTMPRLGPRRGRRELDPRAHRPCQQQVGVGGADAAKQPVEPIGSWTALHPHSSRGWYAAVVAAYRGRFRHPAGRAQIGRALVSQAPPASIPLGR